MHVGVCFCCTSVFLLFRCFPLIVDLFPSDLVGNLELFFLNRLMTFDQRYAKVAFIYASESLFLICHQQELSNPEYENAIKGCKHLNTL